jgi:opacity protein-like surface antigen
MLVRFSLPVALILLAGPALVAQQPGQTPLPYQTNQVYRNTVPATPANPIVRPASTPIGHPANGAIPGRATIGDTYLNNQPTPASSVNSVAQGCGGCDSSGCGGGCDSSGRNGLFGGGCDSSGRGNGGCDSSCGGGCDSSGCGGQAACCGGCCDRYRKVFGGWNNPDDMDGVTTGGPASSAEFNDGWAVGLARGRRLGCNWRWEAEVVWRNNTNDSYDIGNGPVDLTGNINVLSGQQVLIRDFSNVKLLGATPYVGGSIGGAYVDADFIDAGNQVGAISDSAFAYQALVGIERPMSGGAIAFAEYRFFGTTDLELETAAGDIDVQYETQSLFVGLRFCR